MYLTSFSYCEYSDLPRKWDLQPFELETITLLVGKNAAGKTRTLNCIAGIARLLSAKQPMMYESGRYNLAFSETPNQPEPNYRYELHYQNKNVTHERLIEGTVVRLNRAADGSGSIYGEKAGTELDFQIAPNQLAAVVKRDLAQHTFLEHVHEWAQSVRLYRLGRTPQNVGVMVLGELSVDTVFADKNELSLAAAFLAGEKTYGEEAFSREVTKYMNELGYPVEQITVTDLGALPGTKTPPGMPLHILAVKEQDLALPVHQANMSAGMFRALDLLVHMRLATLQDKPFCILIDDVGEGLDFERSAKLIRLLISFVQSSKLQLIMTTNDRFVMNHVPLKYWSVVHREGGTVHVFNQRNAPDKFKEFEDFGLSNFDFFARKIFLKG